MTYWFKVRAYNAAGDSGFSNIASTAGGGSGGGNLVRDGAEVAETTTSGTLGWSDLLGTAASVGVYLDNSDGSLTPDQIARIQDAIASLNSTWDGSKGLLLVLVDDSSQANIIVSNVVSSSVGGQADGLLGTTELSYVITGQQDNGNP